MNSLLHVNANTDPGQQPVVRVEMTLFYARTTIRPPLFSIYAFFKRFYATAIRSDSYASRYREEQALSEDAEKCNAAKADPNARILLFYNLKPLLIKLREYTSVTKWHLYKGDE